MCRPSRGMSHAVIMKAAATEEIHHACCLSFRGSAPWLGGGPGHGDTKQGYPLLPIPRQETRHLQYGSTKSCSRGGHRPG